MNYCIFHYLAGGYDGVMFLQSIETNTARFVYVPEFWDALGQEAPKSTSSISGRRIFRG